jgi:hypothetical protein
MSTDVTPLRSTSHSYVTIITTLYELIEAINAEVQRGEEDLVMPTVMHLLDTSRVTRLHRQEHHN